MILLGAAQASPVALSTGRVPGAHSIYTWKSLKRGQIPSGLTMKSHKTDA